MKQFLESFHIPALLLEDIRQYGCFLCVGKKFGTNNLSENGAGLWRCLECDAWQIVVSKGDYGDPSPIAVGFFGNEPPRPEHYPKISYHPLMQVSIAL